MVERMNHTFEAMLRQCVDDEHTYWDQWLPYCILQYQIYTEQSYARERGADALYRGPHPEANAEPLLSTLGIDEYVTNLQAHLQNIFGYVLHALGVATQWQKKEYNQKITCPRIE